MKRLRQMWDFLTKFPALHRAILAEFDEHNAQMAELRRQVAEADAARRHAQEVSSNLVKEKRALQAEVEKLKRELNTPEVLDFATAVNLEAAHQRQRWGSEHDAGKTDADWFWLAGYLVGKALHKPEKRLHHLITAAAALANWHLATIGKTNMRPGIETPVMDATPEVSKSVVKDSLTTEIAIPSETIASVTAWANETFGQATIWTQIQRAKKEFTELLAGNLSDTDAVAEEAADVCICLYRVIGTLDPEAINKKMAINRARKWNVDGQGCAQHVGEESPAELNARLREMERSQKPKGTY